MKNFRQQQIYEQAMIALQQGGRGHQLNVVNYPNLRTEKVTS